MGVSPFGGGFMFSVVPVFIIIIFVVVIGVIIYRSVQGARQWKSNNESPVLKVEAAVVAKRQDIRHYTNTTMENMPMSSSSTTYYATFEVESGDRMEFKIHDKEYGMLAEGDKGMLTFQGTRYLGFERKSGF